MKKFAKILAAAVLFGTAAGTAFQGAEMIGKNVLVSQNETVKDSASAKLATTTVTTNQRTSTSDVSLISEQVLHRLQPIRRLAHRRVKEPEVHPVLSLLKKITKCTLRQTIMLSKEPLQLPLFLTMRAK